MLYTGLLRESRSCAECGTHLCWANRHAYTNADRHTNSDPIGHAKRNAHSYGYSHNYTYNYAYSYTYRYRNSNSYAHFNTKSPSARSSDATSAPQSVSVIGRARPPGAPTELPSPCLRWNALSSTRWQKALRLYRLISARSGLFAIVPSRRARSTLTARDVNGEASSASLPPQSSLGVAELRPPWYEFSNRSHSCGD